LESVRGPQPPPPRGLRLTSQDSTTSDKYRYEGLADTPDEHDYLQVIYDPDTASQNEVCRL